MRRTASTLSIVIGSLLIIGGVATWIVVSNTLADQKITVSDDASCLAGDEVNGPFSAYCQATVIDKHALEATGGLRYAELDREDPKRQTAMTASFLQASLFTSVVAFGVAAMAIAIGVLFILLGLGIRDVASRLGELAGRPAAARGGGLGGPRGLRGAVPRRYTDPPPTPRVRSARGPGAGGGWLIEYPHRPAPQRPGLPDPDRLRQGLDHPPPELS